MKGLYFSKVLKAAIDEFDRRGGNLDGIHGVHHWIMVYHNATTIAKQLDLDDRAIAIVQHFGLLHDCCRDDDGTDIQHGSRAAEFITELDWLELNSEETVVLQSAVKRHSDGTVTPNKIIGACWDADRLHLTRLGIRPDDQYLSTVVGRRMAWEASFAA